MRVIAALVAVAAVGCRFAPEGGGVPADDDVAAADAAIVDGAIVDGAAVDAAIAIDARAIDARPIDGPGHAACPASYAVTNAGSRYVFRPIAMWRVLAEADCADDLPGQTHLATFENPAEMNGAIAAADPGNSATPWVGARCATEIDCSQRPGWSWATGAGVAPQLWADGQPDNGFTERVARAERLKGTWVLTNVTAASTLPYICECDP